MLTLSRFGIIKYPPSRCLAFNMSSADEKGVKICEHSHQIGALCGSAVEMLKAVLVGVKADSDWTIGTSEHGLRLSNAMHDGQAIALQSMHELSHILNHLFTLSTMKGSRDTAPSPSYCT